MWIDIIIALFFSFVSWLITHIYYKKSLKDQAQEASKEIDKLAKLITPQIKNTNEFLRLEYINQAVAEYRKKGTPVNVIDTLDIPNSEKADIYDAVMMRVKGRLGKSNKYREQT